MVKQTLSKEQQELRIRFQEYTDKYFIRSKHILEAERINPIVRYQVFARQDINALVGVDEAVDFVKSVTKDRTRVYALRDGQKYRAKEPIMKIEGHVQDLIDLETVYLEIISGNLTGNIDLQEVRQKVKAVVQAAQEKPVYYFGARHFHYTLDGPIARICQEEGFKGTSTDIGAKAWDSKGLGTTPHALILAYMAYMQEQGIQGNPTVEAAKAFDRNISEEVPRIILIDTFNREIDDTVATARAVTTLAGARIDTCGENYAQGSKEVTLPKLDVNPKYLNGKGVTIASVWALRQALDNAGFGNLEITVSSGFNEDKTKAFMQADRAYQEKHDKTLFDAIGTGSLAKPIMTTSDIVAYFNEKDKKWRPMSKVGREEKLTNKLKEI